MPVNVIDTIKPKNNGSFPVVEGADVEVSEGLRLPAALAAKADASALADTNSTVSQKANTTDVNAATNNLQGQIDQIVISASSEAVVAPEVADARVNASGTQYSTLKERCDADTNRYDTKLATTNSDVSGVKNLQDWFVVTSNDLEKGYIDGSGVPQTHTQRWRTKNYIAVSAGDVLYTNRLNDGSDNSWTVKINTYDTSQTAVSDLGWKNVGNYTGGYVFQADGYIKMSFQTGSASASSLYNDRVSIIRYTNNFTADMAVISKTASYPKYISKSILKSGYWSGSTFTDSTTRVANIVPLPVEVGDEVHPCVKGTIFDASSGTYWKGYNSFPVKITKDGNLFCNFKNSAGTTINPNDFDKKIYVKKAASIGKIETITKSMMYNGYIDGNHEISYAAHRIVNFDPIHANKGDHVRINNDNIGIYVYEFDKNGNYISQSAVYVPHAKLTGQTHIGDYIVQHDDVWIIVQMYNLAAPSDPVSIDNYIGYASVIHVEKKQPLSPKLLKKARIIDSGTYVIMQDGTMVNGKLWISCDNYADYTVIMSVNITDGEAEQIISHDFGHINSIDYNINNNMLVMCSNKIYLYDISNITGATESISKDDEACIAITLPQGVSIASACWGEDDQTLYVIVGYTAGTDTDINKIYKIILEKSDGVYTGNSSLAITYDMNIVEGGNTVSKKNNFNYVQGCEYDGYLYIGYGNAAHNFLVMELNDDTGVANVVNNYYYRKFSEDRTTESVLEPQIVALNGAKIILGSRDVATSVSLLLEFDR